MRIKRLTTALCCMALTTAMMAQDYPFQNPQLTPDRRADDLLGRLTLSEKVALMQHNAPAIDRLGIKPYNWWNEALHGVARSGLATVFPQTIGMAATFDNDLVHDVFNAISDEARAKNRMAREKNQYRQYQGLTFWTPNINIFRDPRWGRGQETYGEDPYLTSVMGYAAITGLQGPADAPVDKLHACAKHYAVHSGPEWNRHSYDAHDIDLRDLHETYLPAFKVAVQKAHVKEVMCAYNRFEGEPCCGSNRLLTQILRNEWGFTGLVTSDCWAISDFWKKNYHETHPTKEAAAASAVANGTDIECGSDYGSLVKAAEEGLITEDRIDVALRRILKARFELGIMDEKNYWDRIPLSVIDCDNHRQLNLRTALEGIVLLQNKHNILPLKPGTSIAVIGPNAADSTMMWGNYNGIPSHTVTLLDGIKEYVPENKVIYDRACNYATGIQVRSQKRDIYESFHGVNFDNIEENIPALLKKLKKTDIVIFAGGISPKLEGEEMPVSAKGFKGGDRTDIQLPQLQRDLIAALKKAGKKVIFINFSGSAMAMVPEEANTEAIVQVFYPGAEGGRAISKVLFGEYNPAGRLPITFYKDTLQLPDFQDYSMKGRTYRYMTAEPEFAFGFGLSYTQFRYGQAQVADGKITIPVSNIGKRDGDEVVQLYVRRPSDAQGPQRALRAFRRVHIPAGTTTQVEFALTPEVFTWWDTRANDMRPLAGQYALQYGGSSRTQDLQSIDYTYNK